jgi:Ser/Thr protein kinase RdoA (MazF antagonist)
VDGVVHDTGATGVRILDGRVHRRTGPWTPAVHALIEHARAAGFVEAPEVLALDEVAGEEVVRFVPGEILLREDLTLSQLAAVGLLVRRLDEALATFVPQPGHRWRAAATGDRPAHGDVAPWNLVFAGEAIAGLLDWDLAGLAPAGTDLAYALWSCVPLTPEIDLSDDDVATRVRALVEGHGAPPAPERLLELVALTQARVAFDIARGGAGGELGLPGIWRGGRKVGSLGRDMVWLDDRWELLERALR